MVMHLVARIRTALGVEVPMETLFSNPQLQPLADAVDEVAPAARNAGDAPAAEIDAVRADIAERVAGIPRPGPRGAADRDTVLLTGATGFVGRFVLAGLLGAGAHVVCLVRGGAGRRDDLVAGMTDLGLWREEHADRLELVDGDIAAPRLGLSTVDHDRLAAGAGRIVHPPRGSITCTRSNSWPPRTRTAWPACWSSPPPVGARR